MKRGAPTILSGGAAKVPPFLLFLHDGKKHTPHHIAQRRAKPSQPERFEITSGFLKQGPWAACPANELIGMVLGYAGLQEVSQSTFPLGDSGGVTAIAPLPNGFVTAAFDGTVTFWNTDGTQGSVVSDSHRGAVNAFAVTPELVVSVSSDSAAHVYTHDGRQFIRPFIKHRDGLSGVAPLDGDTVVSASTDGAIIKWNARNGEVEQFFLAPSNSCMALLPDRKLVLGAFDPMVRFLDLDGDGQRCIEAKGHSAPMIVGVPLPGGHVATGSYDGTTIVWKDGIPVQRLHSFEPVNALALLPDGTLASAGPDGDVRVWDWMQGDWLRMLTGPKAPVHALAVLDGKLVAADMRGNITEWRWA